MKYVATAYRDMNLKKLEDGHTETFETPYQITEGVKLYFKDLSGPFIVTNVSILIAQPDEIKLLLIPKC